MKDKTVGDLVKEMIHQETDMCEGNLKFRDKDGVVLQVVVEMSLIQVTSGDMTVEFNERRGDYDD